MLTNGALYVLAYAPMRITGAAPALFGRSLAVHLRLGLSVAPRLDREWVPHVQPRLVFVALPVAPTIVAVTGIALAAIWWSSRKRTPPA